jgi:putative tryptophan/tyrosine transport system substrate-binding protein
MRRREFIAGLSGAAAWPVVARAQQPGRVRRIGVLMNSAADDPDGQTRLTGFLQGLQEFGWTAGRNVRIGYRWAPGEPERRKYAAELVALSPDVIGFDQRERIRFAADRQHCAHRICIGH